MSCSVGEEVASDDVCGGDDEGDVEPAAVDKLASCIRVRKSIDETTRGLGLALRLCVFLSSVNFFNESRNTRPT